MSSSPEGLGVGSKSPITLATTSPSFAHLEALSTTPIAPIESKDSISWSEAILSSPKKKRPASFSMTGSPGIYMCAIEKLLNDTFCEYPCKRPIAASKSLPPILHSPSSSSPSSSRSALLLLKTDANKQTSLFKVMQTKLLKKGRAFGDRDCLGGIIVGYMSNGNDVWLLNQCCKFLKTFVHRHMYSTALTRVDGNNDGYADFIMSVVNGDDRFVERRSLVPTASPLALYCSDKQLVKGTRVQRIIIKDLNRGVFSKQRRQQQQQQQQQQQHSESRRDGDAGSRADKSNTNKDLHHEQDDPGVHGTGSGRAKAKNENKTKTDKGTKKKKGKRRIFSALKSLKRFVLGAKRNQNREKILAASGKKHGGIETSSNSPASYSTASTGNATTDEDESDSDDEFDTFVKAMIQGRVRNGNTAVTTTLQPLLDEARYKNERNDKDARESGANASARAGRLEFKRRGGTPKALQTSPLSSHSRSTSSSNLSMPLIPSSLSRSLKQSAKRDCYNVLLGIAGKHKDIGYCQGLDYVVGCVWLIVNDTYEDYLRARGEDNDNTCNGIRLDSFTSGDRSECTSRDGSVSSSTSHFSVSLADNVTQKEWLVYSILSSMLAKTSLPSMYVPGFPLLMKMLSKLESAMMSSMPVLYDHFVNNLEVQITTIALPWFHTLFVRVPSIPLETLKDIYLIFLSTKSFDIFIKASLAIFHVTSPIVLAMEMEECLEFFKTLDGCQEILQRHNLLRAADTWDI